MKFDTASLIKKMTFNIDFCPCCGYTPKLEIAIRKDENRYPRDHWFAKIECHMCGINTGWDCVSEQEADSPDSDRVESLMKIWNSRNKGQ
jgi:hypothetical protein